MGNAKSRSDKIIELVNILLVFGGSITGGILSGVITVIALKTDVKWIIINHDNLAKRVNTLERN